MTTETITINTTEEKNSFVSFIEKAIAGISSYISNTIETRQVTIAINGYGISIGKQSDGSYGIGLLCGESRKDLTFKCVKEFFLRLKNFIMKAWNEGKKAA